MRNYSVKLLVDRKGERKVTFGYVLWRLVVRMGGNGLGSCPVVGSRLNLAAILPVTMLMDIKKSIRKNNFI